MRVSDDGSGGGELVPVELTRFSRIVRQPRGWCPDPGGSWLVDVEPAVKLVSLAVVTVVLSRATNAATIGVLAVCLSVFALLFVRDRRYFFGLLVPVTAVALIVAALKWRSSQEAIADAIRYALFVHTVSALSLVTVLTTRLLDLAYALDWMLWPLRWIRIDSRSIALGVMLAVRLFIEAVSLALGIVKAHRSRGMNFRGPGGIRRIVLPLIVRLGQSSELLADSLALRGLVPRATYSLRPRDFDVRSTLIYIAMMSVAALALLWP